MKNLLSFVFLLCFSSLFAQNKVCGTVIDSKTREPIQFANLGIPLIGVGTVSDLAGNFCLNIADSIKSNSFVVSCLGYKKTSLNLAELLANKHTLIELKTNAIELRTVTIKPKKTKRLGNKIDSKMVSAGFSSNELGCEVGVLYKTKKTVRIKDLNFNVSSLSYDSVFYRINVYEMLPDGLPGENILNENILGVITNTGWHNIPLQDHNIICTKNFIISLEWIRDPYNKGSGINFTAGFLTANPLVARQASQGQWKKVRGVGLGFYTTVEY